MKQYRIITTIFYVHEYEGETIYESYEAVCQEVEMLNEKAKRLGVSKFCSYAIVEHIPKKKKWWRV